MRINKIKITALDFEGNVVKHVEEVPPFLMSKYEMHLKQASNDILAGRVCRLLVEREPLGIDEAVNPATGQYRWWYEKEEF